MNRYLKVVRVEKIVGKQEMFTSTYTYNTHVLYVVYSLHSLIKICGSLTLGKLIWLPNLPGVV